MLETNKFGPRVVRLRFEGESMCSWLLRTAAQEKSLWSEGQETKYCTNGDNCVLVVLHSYIYKVVV